MNLESNIHHITKYGFKITMIRIDGESAVNTLSFESKLAALGIIVWVNCYILLFQLKCDLIKGYVRRLNELRPVVEVLGNEYGNVIN